MSTGEDSVRDRTHRARQVVAWSLALFGSIDLLAACAFLMPTSWIRMGHEICGFGPFPAGPVPEYLARATSLLWTMHGGVLIYLSRDVHRYADLIRFLAKFTVLAGGLLLFLSLKTGLPIWWVCLEGPVFAATGFWYLWWLRRCE